MQKLLNEWRKYLIEEEVGIPFTNFKIKHPKEWLAWLAPETTNKIKKWAYNKYAKQVDIPLIGELGDDFEKELFKIIQRTGKDYDDHQTLQKEKMRWNTIKDMIRLQDPTGKEWDEFFEKFIKKYYSSFNPKEQYAADLLFGRGDNRTSGSKTMLRQARVKKAISKKEMGDATAQDFKTGYLLFNQRKNKLFWMSRKHKILKCWTAVSGHPDADKYGSLFPSARVTLGMAHVISPKKKDHEDLLKLFSKFIKAIYQKDKDIGPIPEGIYIAQNFQRKPYPWKNWKASIQHLLAGGYSELRIKEEERRTLNQALVNLGLLDKRYINTKGTIKYDRAKTTLGWQKHKWWKVGKNGIGATGWGFHRIWLKPVKGTKTYGRNGFTIHGGDTFASAGCIDLSKEMPDFVRYWTKFKGNKGKIKVVVRYDDFPTGKCPD